MDGSEVVEEWSNVPQHWTETRFWFTSLLRHRRFHVYGLWNADQNRFVRMLTRNDVGGGGHVFWSDFPEHWAGEKFVVTEVEDIPGCEGFLPPGNRANVCYQPPIADGEKSDGTLDVGRRPLEQCMGDCDRNSDCEDGMVCFTPVNGQVPGCKGDVQPGFDYCISKAWLDWLEKAGPKAAGGHWAYGEARCAGAHASLPGVSASGFSPPALRIDPSPKLKICAGNCNQDSDCASGLKCFQRSSGDLITGCSGKPINTWDYCYNPNLRWLVDYSEQQPGLPAAACQRCHEDSDCSAGLLCYRRNVGESAPGCKDIPPKAYSVCYDPSAPTEALIDSTPGQAGKARLEECAGHCTKDEDCEVGMVCYGPKLHDGNVVPGCKGIPEMDKGYCVLDSGRYGPGSAALPPLDNSHSPHPPALGECEGRCDKDQHCATGLKCFKSIGDVPGCIGVRSCGWGYCYDPDKKTPEKPYGRDDKLDEYGFVWRRATSASEGFQVQATHGAEYCLEVEYSEATGVAALLDAPHGQASTPEASRAATFSFLELASTVAGATPYDAMSTAKCKTPAPHRQVLSPAMLPSLLQEQLNSPTFVPPIAVAEIASTFSEAKLTDFLLTQDCGEHALGGFGWSDHNSNGRLEIWATCAQAAVLGAFVEKEAVLGGELSFEFTTCAKFDAETTSNLQAQFNRQQKVQLGGSGRGRGQKDRHVLTYSEPFERLMITLETNNDWQVCRLTAGSQEVPSPGLDVNVAQFPCWVTTTDAGTSHDCSTNALIVSGNRMQQELANARIECEPGQALTFLKKEATRFIYRCAHIAGMGACTPGQTPQVDTSSGRFDALQNVQIMCPEGSVLQSLVAEESSGGWWLRYRYSCCAIDGVPVAVLPTGRSMNKGKVPEEGVYCPATLDASGRPKMEQVKKWGTATDSPLVSFKHNAVKWCIGDNCIKSDVAHPLQLPLSDDLPFVITPVGNFDGEFEAKGVSGKRKAKRKFPELVKYGTAEPEYAAECKDESMPDTPSFDPEVMNEVAEGLPDGNPCKLVAGKWIEGEPEGSAYTEYPYEDGNMAVGEQGAGITYDTVRSCGDREIARDLANANWGFGFSTAGNALDLIHNAITVPCSLAPDMEAAPLGLGIQFKTGDLCKSIMDHVFGAMHSVKDIVHDNLEYQMALGDNADCNSLQYGLSRIFCDLHCVRDAVKAGDQAILKSLSEAVTVMQTNINSMLEFYSGGLQDTLDEMKEEAKGGSFVERSQRLRRGFLAMFREMRGMVNGTVISDLSKVSVLRAAKGFTSRFGRTNGTALRSGKLLDDMNGHAQELLEVVRLASADSVPATSYAATQSTTMLVHLHSVARMRAHTLGVFRDVSAESKVRQQHINSRATLADLHDEIDTVSARDLLAQLDRSWWDARDALDAYLEVADEQVAAYRHAFLEFEDYTSKCQAHFSDLQGHYDKAMAAEAKAVQQLQKTWHDATRTFGTLSSQLVDGDAFLQFARLDTFSISVDSLGLSAEQFCRNQQSALRAGATTPSADVMKAVETAVIETTSKGYAGQTWHQVGTLAAHFPMLRSRFESHSLAAPDMSEVKLALHRVGRAFASAAGRSDELTEQVLARLRRQACA